MKRFSEINEGDQFTSECTISEEDLEKYLSFSGIKNVIYESNDKTLANKMVSGRAILSRIEGEFTRLKEMYGNMLILYGIDGDPSWNCRQTRFLKPLHTNDTLKMRFTISGKRDLNNEFGLLSVDFEGSKDKEIVLVSKRNLYQIKK